MLKIMGHICKIHVNALALWVYGLHHLRQAKSGALIRR